MYVAGELMTENPTAIVSSAKVSEAVELFQALDVRHLPVVNEDRNLLGMLSDRDLRSLVVPQLVGSEWLGSVQTALDARVSTLMSGNVISVDLDSGADEIIELMLEHKIGAVPVIDADGKLVGIVSYVDLLRQIASQLDG